VTVLLADDLFCIGHRHRSGRARIHPRACGLGLAAGLLGELVLFGRLEVRDGDVRVLRTEPPPDALAHTTLDLLLGQPQHRPVRTWLAYLAATSTDSVGQRLTRAGVVQRVRRRRLLGSREVYLPIDGVRSAWPEVRLARTLTGGGLLGEADAALAGLVAVTGLARHVLWDPATYDAGFAHLLRTLACLPPSMSELVAHTEAAVGDAVLAPR
jgi:hypothetical protein